MCSYPLKKTASKKLPSFSAKTGQKKNLSAFHKLNTQWVRFLIVGTFNTLFSYSLYTFLLFMGIEYKAANFGSLAIGIVVGFNTQGRFVFDNADSKLFIRFAICWFFIYLFNIFLIGKFIYFGFNPYQAGAIAIIPVTVCSYLAQKLIVFNKHKKILISQ